MEKLTKEQIEECRENLNHVHPEDKERTDALCSMALRSLELEEALVKINSGGRHKGGEFCVPAAPYSECVCSDGDDPYAIAQAALAKKEA